ncbi:MAG: ABC transporter ATP-binding protein [Methanosphaera sp.]|nr:ABC transporter ATP-binding protein [Methanosphaera sp.]
MDKEELLSVSNLSISFTQYVEGLRQRTTTVISDLSLDVCEGEIVAILGSSGSGKSLLADTIFGILPNNATTTGNITYKDELLTQELKEEIRGDKIVLIPQSVNYLDPLMTVSEQAIGSYEEEDEKEEKLKHQREVFSKYGLDESVDSMYPFELSGGMARKVLLSTALLSNPKVVIADEPTPGLDQEAVDETIDDLLSMKKDNKGVLLITHDINVALRVADRIAIFYAGYVIEINKTENFHDVSKLKHPYTRSLIEALPENGFRLDLGMQPHSDPVGCVYYDNCPHRMDKCKDNKPKLEFVNGTAIRCFKPLGE